MFYNYMLTRFIELLLSQFEGAGDRLTQSQIKILLTRKIIQDCIFLVETNSFLTLLGHLYQITR